MTKKIKKLVIIIIVTLTIININVVCYKIYGANGAATSATGGIGDVIKNAKENPTVNPDYYDPVNYDQAQNAGKLANIGNEIIGFLQIIGMIVSVAVLAILGIKYMMGSVEEKAEYKKTMQPYLIGAIMVFSITSILGFIAPLAKTLFYE